jgi:hypothetical protein
MSQAVFPKMGLYRSDPLAPRVRSAPLPSKRLYLALLGDGRFVRAMAPAEGFHFAGFVGGLLGDADAGAVRADESRGAYFHHVGDYEADGLRIHFSAQLVVGRTLYLQRWSAGCLTAELLLSQGDLYRFFMPLAGDS